MAYDAIVVGLGNPGPKYLLNRHNAGFILLDLWASHLRESFSLKKDLEAEVADFREGDLKILALKPQTYMNLSGKALARLYRKNKDLKEVPLIVVHDEADLPLGRVRVKKGGSDAGHNGLKSMRESLGNGDSYRVRLGVGRPPRGAHIDVADYLLSDFAKAEQEKLTDMLSGSIDLVVMLAQDKLSRAQEEAGKIGKDNESLGT